MADQGVATEQLLQQYDIAKAQYREMEAAYKRQVEQLVSNPEITSKKRELRNTRAACSELSDERDALLDRILELERAARPHDRSLDSWTGTHKETQLRAHLEPSFNERVALDFNPHSTSRHCGPAAVQAFHQRATQRDIMQQEQAFPIKAEDRDIIKLPKRSRTSKSTANAGVTGGVSHQAQTQAHELAATSSTNASLLHGASIETSASGISDPSSGIRQLEGGAHAPTGLSALSQTQTKQPSSRARVKSGGRGSKGGAAAASIGMAKGDTEEGHPSGDVAASMPRDMPE